MPALPIVHLARLVETGARFVIGGAVAGAALALLIRWRGRSWVSGLPVLAAIPGLTLLSWQAQVCSDACAAAVVGDGGCRHVVNLRAGGDLARRARDRVSPMTPVRRWRGWRKLRKGGRVTSGGVAIGFTRKGELVRIPVAGLRAVMSLLLGATGSGKTILQVLLALAAIKRGMGVTYIDPKGNDVVLEQLSSAAAREGRRLRRWDPQGKTIYNPYDRGSDTEIADMFLAAEVFTEPHCQRLAQRYTGHVVRALRLAGVPVSLATVVEHMHSGWLSSLIRKMSPTDARPLLAYLETLTPQQERDLSGAPQTPRLFGRGRGAGLSQLVGTQEVADLGSADTDVPGGGGGILPKIAGNIEVLLCGRQNIPASAELVAEIAGTRGAWITTQQTRAPAAGLLTGLGSRSRGREYVIHPDTIKSLDVGEFAVIEPRRRRAVVVRVFHPDELHRRGVEC